MLSVVIERLKLSACSFFLFVLKQKEKTNQKRKTRLLQYRLWRYKTANAVICVFAYRQKSLSAPKDNGARFQDVRPLRSEQSLFATRQQGGIWSGSFFAPRFFAVKEMGQGSFDETKTTYNIYYVIYYAFLQKSTIVFI